MNNKIKIKIKSKKILNAVPGISIIEILKTKDYSDLSRDAVAAIVNNKLMDLNYRCYHDCDVEIININSDIGLKIYRQSAVHILAYAVKRLFNKDILTIGPSINFNYYFDLDFKQKITINIIQKIKQEMRNIIKANLPIKYEYLTKSEAIYFYKRIRSFNKVKLVKALSAESLKFYYIDDFKEMYLGPLVPFTGYLRLFDLIHYENGFLLQFPVSHKKNIQMQKITSIKKLSKAFLETRGWYKKLGVSTVADLNDIIEKGKIAELIRVSEALHEKRISQIADEITEHSTKKRIILIAGPSSSGKTTFSKRLFTQLKVNGINPLVLSLDSYYFNREDTPRDEYGNYDFETINALDLKLLNKDLVSFLKGQMVLVPKFSFEKGKRLKSGTEMRLKNDELLIIEGIHALNDKLTFSIPSDKKFKIYVSALNQLRINNIQRISTTDNRLIRRTVRDYLFRGTSGLDTLKQWYSVRRGEENNIFRFQEEADIMFNSALIYEIAVLKSFASKYLLNVTSKHPENIIANRIQAMLSFFIEIPTRDVPKTSILREFIGGSSFKY